MDQRNSVRARWIGVLGVLLLAGAFAFAALNGSMTVVVKDKAGAPLPGATVVITSPAMMGQRSAVTNEKGEVRFNAIPAGDYKAAVTMQGYSPRSLDNIPVKLDENRQVVIGVSEEIVEAVTVTSKPPAVDTATTQISQDLPRSFVNDMPIGRDYLTNFTRVPGVGTGSNPGVKGGTSTDNLYLIDGVNTTDPVTGTFGTNINFEIIDQQSVTTGGHMAEYGGVVGMVSNVITKSGGNQWSGSATYFRNDANWAAKAKPDAVLIPDTTDYNYAYTLGGPILADKLWHFTSWQKVYSTTEVASGRPPREFDGKRPFAKLTWQITPNHRTSFAVNAEEATILNVNTATSYLSPDQFYKQIQGGPTYTAKYQGLLGNDLILEGQANFFRGKLDAVPQHPDLPANTQVNGFLQQYGRYSNEQTSKRYRDEYRLDLTYFKSTGWGDHNLKVGVDYASTKFRSLNINSGGIRYLDQPATWAGGNRNFLQHTSSALNRLNRWRTIANLYGFGCTIGGVACNNITSTSGLPADASQWVWTVGESDFTAAQFNFGSLSQNAQSADAGNYRFFAYANGPGGSDPTGTHMWSAFAQDDWKYGNLAIRLGLRMDKQSLYDSNGNNFYNFDPIWGPRLGVSYDVAGDGKSKVFLHAGRLTDPLRDNTANFAGALSSPVSDTQLWLGGPEGWNDGYYTFLRAGGPGAAGSVISPKLKTPATDELILGYSRDLGKDMTIEFSAYNRRTKNITEDFDPLYGLGDPELFPTLQGNPTLESLGFTDVNGDGVVDVDDIPAAYVVYNPPNAVRRAKGFDITWTKRLSNNWQAMASYSHINSQGNVPDDGLYGSVGDDPYLDPRLGFNYGPLSLGRDHFFQALGSYKLKFGLTIGLEYRAYSGVHDSMTISTGDFSGIWDGDPSKLVDSLRIDRTDFAGQTDAEIVAQVPFELKAGRGAYINPWFQAFNLRLRQDVTLYKKIHGEFFLDVYNVLNRQKVTTNTYSMTTPGTITPDNIGDRSAYNFDSTYATQPPRSFNAGVRVSF